MKILLVCDRSGGHIFPALSLGKKIRNNSTKNVSGIYFFATADFFKDYLKKENFLVYGKSFSSRNIVFEMVYRAFEAIYLLLRLRPQKVIGFGGRDSFFLVFFSSLFFLDTTIYEPNLRLGKTNKILSYFVRKIWRGFDEGINAVKSTAIGIPLRDNIKRIEKKEALRMLGFDNKPTIFCFGGSQGSSFLNSIFMELVEKLEGEYQIIHFTGKREYFEISERYIKIKQGKFVRDFYYSMEVPYSAADLVICRAGASTLGEISYYQLPSILIPHPQAGGHQKDNAFYFANKGAAFMFTQDKFSFADFKNTVEQFFHDDNIREKMKINLSKIRLGVCFEDFCDNTYL